MGGSFLTPLHNYRSRVGRKHSRGVTMTIGMAYETLTVTRFDAIEHVGNSFASGLINQLEALAVFRNSDNRGERCGTDLGADKNVARARDYHASVGRRTAQESNRLAIDQNIADAFGDSVSARCGVSDTQTGIPLMFTSPEPLLPGLGHGL